MATQGPEQVFSIRFPIWYLPVLHLMLLAAFSVVATEAGFARPTRPRIWGVVLVAYFGWLASVQSDPEMRTPAFLGALVILGLTVLGRALSARWRHGYEVAGLVGTAVFAVATHLFIPTNGDQLDRGAPSAVTAVSDLAAIPTSASVFLGDINEAVIWEAPEIETGIMPLMHGGANPFGYSPVGHRAFSYQFWLQLWGTPAPAAKLGLFQPALGGLTWADLLRVDRVIVPRVHNRPELVAAAAGTGWRVAENRPYTVAFERITHPPRGPGSVAWMSPGLKVASVGAASASNEVLAVHSRSGHDDRIVFDRIAWPGYHVTFAGKPLELSLTANPLMGTILPDGPTTGDLRLTYAPPFIDLGVACALLALGGVVLGGWWWSRVFASPHAEPAAKC